MIIILAIVSSVASQLQVPQLVLQFKFYAFMTAMLESVFGVLSFARILHVLGHRSIQSTMRYIALEKTLFKSPSDEFCSAVANSVEEARSLIESGFDYVCDFNTVKIFRKRK